MDVEEERAAGVRDIGGMHATAREPPDQEGVDRAEQDLAGLAPRPQPRHRLQEVHDLGGGEIGIEEQASAAADVVLDALRPEAAADGRRDAALPDNRRRHGLAGGAVPEDRRLPLVGDADGGNLLSRSAARLQHASGARELRPPDGFRVVLHDGDVFSGGVARGLCSYDLRPRDLGKLLLRRRQRNSTPVEEDRPA